MNWTFRRTCCTLWTNDSPAFRLLNTLCLLPQTLPGQWAQPTATRLTWAAWWATRLSSAPPGPYRPPWSPWARRWTASPHPIRSLHHLWARRLYRCRPRPTWTLDNSAVRRWEQRARVGVLMIASPLLGCSALLLIAHRGKMAFKVHENRNGISRRVIKWSWAAITFRIVHKYCIKKMQIHIPNNNNKKPHIDQRFWLSDNVFCQANQCSATLQKCNANTLHGTRMWCTESRDQLTSNITATLLRVAVT